MKSKVLKNDKLSSGDEKGDIKLIIVESPSQDETIIDGAWRKVISGDTGMVDLQRKPRRPSSDAKEVREEFKEYFVSNAGKVPWQDLYA